MRHPFPLILTCGALILADRAPAQDTTPAGLEFFETKIRPVLVEHCYRCHSDATKNPKGGLRLDGRAAMLKGGDGGPALVPGDPKKSKLFEAITYKNTDLQMPPKAKLPEAVVGDIRRWIDMGAPWPAEKPRKEVNPETFNLQERKKAHWCWGPIRTQVPPGVRETSWPRGVVDTFLLARLEAQGIRPSVDAKEIALVRRWFFDLVGLPPTPQDLETFLADPPELRAERLVDRLLASPHFGERWSRHWLDLVRYGETRGHEFDPIIPNAHEYRDYVIRAFNADVPYHHFLLEHLAGDLLEQPRLDPSTGANESILGTGFWLLGEEVHSPVDIRQDQADRFDNRIDVLTKTFLGLTVACARCHEHKFDAISQKDYYALFGIVASTRARLVPFETLEHNRVVARDLWQLRTRNDSVTRRLIGAAVREGARAGNLDSPKEDRPTREGEVVVDFATTPWIPDGFAFGPGPAHQGEVRWGGVPGRPTVRLVERTTAEYDTAWDGLVPAAISQREPGALGNFSVRPGRTLVTPVFPLTTGRVSVLVRGAGGIYASVGAHTMIAGPLHGQLVATLGKSDVFRWVDLDLTRYQGLHVHLEFTPTPGANFAVVRVVQGSGKPGAPEPVAPLESLEEAARAIEDGKSPRNPGMVNRLLTQLDRLGQPGAALIAHLSQRLMEEQSLRSRIRQESRWGLALQDISGVDERLFIRGSPRVLGEAVPRRFLEALAGPRPLGDTQGSGRRKLAEQMIDPSLNPLVARVYVNRVWHHLFGRGLVGSVDNFGVLGEAPTHPELLDELADRFVRQGWSTKQLIRELVLSRAYAQSSQPRPDAEANDPQNLLLHRARLRRLEGEAIRDALLSLSGRLDLRMGGPSVPIFLTPFLEGRGRPSSGPLDGDGRRSIYLAVKRNFLSPLLLAFDTPTPFSTVGRRTVSNVPAQALILLNDPFVHQQSRLWATQTLAHEAQPEQRIMRMYRQAFGRIPSPEEQRTCAEFLAAQARQLGASETDPGVWTDLAHTLINVKDFVYLD